MSGHDCPSARLITGTRCSCCHCDDCGDFDPPGGLLIVSADLGEGAFLAVLCAVCWHRRQYVAELKRRRDTTHKLRLG